MSTNVPLQALVLAASLAWLLPVPPAYAVQLNPGDILVADDTASSIIRVNPATGAQTVISSGGAFVDPSGITVASDGTLLIADPSAFGGPCPVGCGGIIRVNPGTGGQAMVSSGGVFVNPRAIAIASNGDLIVVDEGPFIGTGSIVRVNPLTGEQTVISSGGDLINAVGIVIAKGGDLLVVSQNAFGGSGGIIRIDPISGAQTVLSSGGSFVEPFGVALAESGALFVTDPDALGGAIFRIDPLTGTQTTIASGGLLGGDLRGIGIGLDGALLVAIRDTKAVVRIDPETGSQAFVSSGGSFASPQGVAIAPVPEPATLALLGSGLVGLAGLAWRRHHKSQPDVS